MDKHIERGSGWKPRLICPSDAMYSIVKKKAQRECLAFIVARPAADAAMTYSIVMILSDCDYHLED